MCRSDEANKFQWRLANGLWGLLLAFGTTIAALIVQQARSWRYATDLFRSFLADYGVPLVVVAFSGLSYALKGVPEGIPRRVVLPNTLEVKATWTVTHVSEGLAMLAHRVLCIEISYASLCGRACVFL